MTVPLPTAYTSPIAGFVNAAARLAIRGLDQRARGLAVLIADARELNHALITARDFADTDEAGYIDRTDIWGTQ